MKIITQKEFAEKFNDRPVYLHFTNNTLYLTADNEHCVDANQLVKESVCKLVCSAIKDAVLDTSYYKTETGASRSQDYL